MTQMFADEEEGGSKDPQTYVIIGAAMEVHRHLGHGFLEAVYQAALEVELKARGIVYQPQPELIVHYKGHPLDCKYKPDFVCFESVIVEIKALGELTSREEAQLINYLKATGLTRGLLLNFGTSRLEYRRFVRSYSAS